MSCLVIAVTSHEGRFHGLGTDGRSEWPPSPARLFQALVAAACKGSMLAKADKDALEWLERLAPPVIAAPVSDAGQTFNHFMPNNDLDAKGGDPRHIGEVRKATKRYRPRIFDPKIPILYVWPFEGDDVLANLICEMVEQLYQLGRGVDMAWAVGEVVDEYEAESRLVAYPSAVYHPALNGTGDTLPCPNPGSLHSLTARYRANRERSKLEALAKTNPSRAKAPASTPAQLPQSSFRQIAYASPATRLLYELRDGSKSAGFHVWPLREAGALVKIVRDDCADRLEASLKSQLPDKAAVVKHVFGRCRDAIEADKARRIRIIPLPSIGHPHADRGIRRILVEIPPNCPIRVQDIDWAFTGFCKFDVSTGEIDWMLTKAEEQTMLGHYGIGSDEKPGFRTWRTVTPMALPIQRPHGRDNGTQRADVEERAANAVVQALRHAGVTRKPASIRVQREPFDIKGAMAQDFAAYTRFDASRLWHAETIFAQPVSGPLLVGNGRYLGLGLMKPVKQVEGVRAFVITDGLLSDANPQTITHALRRAVMARVQDEIGSRKALPLFFTGHEVNGSPARRGGRAHLAFAFDAPRRRLLIFAPHLLERRKPGEDERVHLGLLDTALTGLRELRAGSAGRLTLMPQTIDMDTDSMFALSQTWTTQTDYQPTRYSKSDTPEQAIVADIKLELQRRSLPAPNKIIPARVARGPRGGLRAQLELEFATVIKGPLILGRDCNFGGGLFVTNDE